MPRTSRKNIETNFLHIIVQGINREFIFNNDEFKQMYKQILKKNISQTNIKILSYCIMDNHAHIIVYGDNIEEISKVMQKVNTSYAKFYNSKNKRVGFVFRNRYYTQPITSQRQLLNCLAYVHNNPIKANMVSKLEDYKYSSYLEYISKKELISEDAIELIFGDYENYMHTFEKIHKKYNAEEILDVVDEYKNSEDVIKEFMNTNNKTLEEIENNEKLFRELLINLRYMSGISLRTMSNIFNISKDKLGRVINKVQ